LVKPAADEHQIFLRDAVMPLTKAWSVRWFTLLPPLSI
jgi:hypothetical protein